MTEIDVSRPPLGLKAAEKLVQAVVEQGDFSEHHYLELKSELNFSNKIEREKVAKFVLGAANRDPEIAERFFGGYAVMIIGVGENGATGIEQVEHLTISQGIEKFLGSDGPRWDVLWVPIADSDKKVLLILVDPPEPGQEMFVCRADGQNIHDGEVYIRAQGASRKAKSGEIDRLLKRGKSLGRNDVDFHVGLSGDVTWFEADTATIRDEFIARIKGRLLDALPKARRESTDSFAALQSEWTKALNIYSSREERSQQEYKNQIHEWEKDFTEIWECLEEELYLENLRPLMLSVENRAKTFFNDVEVEVTFDERLRPWSVGDNDLTDVIDLLPEPPEIWGDKPLKISGLVGSPMDWNFPHQPPLGIASLGVELVRETPFTLQFKIGELRPLATSTIEASPYIFLIRPDDREIFRCTWQLTARGHHEVFSGEIKLEHTRPPVIEEAARQVLKAFETRLEEAEQ